MLEVGVEIDIKGWMDRMGRGGPIVSAIQHLPACYGRLVSRGSVPIIIVLVCSGQVPRHGLPPLFYSVINAPLRIFFSLPFPGTTLQGGTFPFAVIHGHRTPKALHPVRSAKLTGVPPS